MTAPHSLLLIALVGLLISVILLCGGCTHTHPHTHTQITTEWVVSREKGESNVFEVVGTNQEECGEGDR